MAQIHGDVPLAGGQEACGSLSAYTRVLIIKYVTLHATWSPTVRSLHVGPLFTNTTIVYNSECSGVTRGI